MKFLFFQKLSFHLSQDVHSSFATRVIYIHNQTWLEMIVLIRRQIIHQTKSVKRNLSLHRRSKNKCKCRKNILWKRKFLFTGNKIELRTPCFFYPPTARYKIVLRLYNDRYCCEFAIGCSKRLPIHSYNWTSNEFIYKTDSFNCSISQDLTYWQ